MMCAPAALSTVPPNDVPHTVSDMINLAEYYLSRFEETQTVVDMFAAILATVHVADWYIEGTLGRDFRENKLKEKFKEDFPEWGTLLDIANGFKHSHRRPDPSPARNLQLTQSHPEWEDIDGWDHLHQSDQVIWRIEHNNEERSVYSLCRLFLDQFVTWLNYCPPRSACWQSV